MILPTSIDGPRALILWTRDNRKRKSIITMPEKQSDWPTIWTNHNVSPEEILQIIPIMPILENNKTIWPNIVFESLNQSH